MSYATLVEKEGINAQFLVVMKPSKHHTSWTNILGNTYYTNWTYGYAVKMTSNGVELTQDNNNLPSINKWYYDHEAQKIYINIATIATKYLVITFELYFGTIDAHWYRNPLDNTTTQVYFDPLITKPPTLKYSLSDSIFGYIPSQTTQMTIGNPEHDYEQILYDCSFNKKDVSVYHWLGDLEVSNIKLIIKGLCSNVDYNTSNITFNIVDRVDIFNKEYRNATYSFYGTTEFPDIDPNFIGRPVRYVYGSVDDIQCVNLDYTPVNPTTSDNRIWGVMEGLTNTVTKTVGNASTTTRTYLNNVIGLQIGDQVKFDRVVGTDEYHEITVIGVNYIEHVVLTSGAMASGDSVLRQTIGYIQIEQSGSLYKVPYNLFTTSILNNVTVVTLDSTLEASLSMTTLTGYERVFARTYGKVNDVIKNAIPFGSDSSTYGNLTNPAVILFDLLKKLGIGESEINLTSFDDLSTDISGQEIGFAIPNNINNDFPLYKDLILDIISSTLTKLYIDSDYKWKVGSIEPLGTSTTTIQNDEILFNTIKYNIDYSDVLSEIIVGYRFNERTNQYSKESQNSNDGKYLHEISKQKTFNTLLLDSIDASNLAYRLSYIYGDRQGRLSINVKNRFFTYNINDIINIELDKLLGYAYVRDLLRARKFNVMEIEKNLHYVRFTLDDQKGIEDNSSSW